MNDALDLRPRAVQPRVDENFLGRFQTFAAFEKGFAHTRATKVKTGTLGPSEGAAGSIYQTVPVTVEATLDDGSAQRFAGSYVVRRINNVDGASPSQLRWHLASATLRPAPVK